MEKRLVLLKLVLVLVGLLFLLGWTRHNTTSRKPLSQLANITTLYFGPDFDSITFPDCKSEVMSLLRNTSQERISLCKAMRRIYDSTGEARGANELPSIWDSPKKDDLCPHPAYSMDKIRYLEATENPRTISQFPTMKSEVSPTLIQRVWDTGTFPGRPYSLEHLQITNLCFYLDRFYFSSPYERPCDKTSTALFPKSKRDGLWAKVTEQDLACLLRMESWRTSSPHWDYSRGRMEKDGPFTPLCGARRLIWQKGTTYFLEQLWFGNNLSFWFRAVLHLFILSEYPNAAVRLEHISHVLLLNHPSEFGEQLTPWESGFYQSVLSKEGHKGPPPIQFLHQLPKTKINEFTESHNETAVFFEHVVMVPPLNRQLQLPPSGYARLRKRVYQWAGIDEDMEKAVTLVHRSESRRILNEDEIINLLANRYSVSVTIVDFAKLSYPEQVAATARSWLLIGTHGAGLMNIIFMEGGSSVIELRPFSDDKRTYRGSAVELGLDFYHIESSREETIGLDGQQRKGFFLDNDFIVNCGRLTEALDEIFHKRKAAK